MRGEGRGGEGRGPPAGQGRRCEVRGSVGGEGAERGTRRECGTGEWEGEERWVRTFLEGECGMVGRLVAPGDGGKTVGGRDGQQRHRLTASLIEVTRG